MPGCHSCQASVGPAENPGPGKSMGYSCHLSNISLLCLYFHEGKLKSFHLKYLFFLKLKMSSLLKSKFLALERMERGSEQPQPVVHPLGLLSSGCIDTGHGLCEKPKMGAKSVLLLPLIGGIFPWGRAGLRWLVGLTQRSREVKLWDYQRDDIWSLLASISGPWNGLWEPRLTV